MRLPSGGGLQPAGGALESAGSAQQSGDSRRTADSSGFNSGYDSAGPESAQFLWQQLQPTGVYDAQTQAALFQFQTKYGLAADGTINAQVLQLFGLG